MRNERRFITTRRHLGEDDAWALVRCMPRPASERQGYTLVGARAVACAVAEALLVVDPCGDPPWSATLDVSPEARTVLELCVPLCIGERARDLVVAHLGQSLDGRVATPEGVSRLITGIEDVRHTHRLRALFDAVLIGATTADVDDPRLTTRLVDGEDPVRVVIDPRGRLRGDLRIFTDGVVRSIVVVGRDYAGRHGALPSFVEVLPLELDGDDLSVWAILRALRERGLRRVFVEGGGITVSRFLDARALNRLHLAIASRIIGCGSPALELRVASDIAAAAPPSRRYLLGSDVLFDCDFSAALAREPERS